jgi:hypothetical protein
MTLGTCKDGLVAVTVTPGRTLPVSSFTCPMMLAWVSCSASAGLARESTTRQELARLAPHDLRDAGGARAGLRQADLPLCARGEASRRAVTQWTGDGKTRSQHVPYAVVDTVRAGVDAWDRFQAIARELAHRNRAQVWTRARRKGQIR